MSEMLSAATRLGFLVDSSRCIGCRSCQVACQQWNKLEAEKTTNTGSFQNPKELTPLLYNLIRFEESADAKGNVTWRFRSERCMHCGDAGCIKVCPSPGALYRTRDGVVGFDKEKCISCKYCVSACPFNIPRYDADNKVAKCNLCLDRLAAGMAPACAKACPTETLKYGVRNELVAKVKAAKKTVYAETELGGLGVVYAMEGKPEQYGLPARPTIPMSIFLWKDVIKPLGILGFWGSIGAILLHYVTVGPKVIDDDNGDTGGTSHE
jgi:formate dehydrogenase iron-sulfur subunit